MFICLVLCLTAILSAAFSESVMESTQSQRSEELAHRYAAAAAAAAAARNLGIYIPGWQSGENDANEETTIATPVTYVDGSGNQIYFSGDPKTRKFWVFFPAIFNAMSSAYHMIRNNRRSFDYPDGVNDVSRNPGLDSIGGGHLLKRAPALDSIGGGNLLKRTSILDPIGGGHLLKREYWQKQSFGNTNKRRPVLDSIGGGHLLKRFSELSQPYTTDAEDIDKKNRDNL